ncbi:MAG: CPBP family intramembrane glutamic endopeptidase [Longimicrobiales bacterium]|nr:CPBP family intramembrane glutamic endopeptidase [Longimicrobiales bacterium]
MSALRSTAARVGEIVAVFVPAAVVLVFAWPGASYDPATWQATVWGANVLMLGVVWAGLRLRGQGWAHLGLRRWPGPRGALATVLRSLVALLVGLLGFGVGAVVGGALLGVPEGADMSGYDYFAGDLPLFLLVLVAVWIVSSFGEEVIYRGFLITRLAELWGGSRTALWCAVVAAGVIFGLVHFTWGVVGILETALMGIGLGAVYVKLGRSLWVTILAHAYMDTLLMVQLYLAG